MDATLVEAQVKKAPCRRVVEQRVRRTLMRSGAGVGLAGGRTLATRCTWGWMLGVGRRAKLTSARVYESAVADELVSCDEGEVYGDRAYESKRRREWLRSQGIGDMIMHRSHKHQRELPEWQKLHNELIRPRRALVEKVRDPETQLWVQQGALSGSGA